ncbi:replication-relaxation family protein [Nocardia takedensis]|nr:hypothetical protein FEK35_15805 [Nocardia cyriacigeorgica]
MAMNANYSISAERPDHAEASPLAVVRSALDRIADHPLPVVRNQVSGLGRQVDTWGQLRQVLSDPALPIETVDAVWVWLIGRSRTHGSDAALACAGMAAPMLAGMASVFGPRRREDRADIEADLLAEFFAELPRIDVERPFLWFRLRWALFRGGRAWVRREAAAPVPGADVGTGADIDTRADEPVQVMWAPAGHPEQILAEAVAENVITAEVAELIAATRLEGRSVTSLASDSTGLSHWALRKTRQRGEHDLLDWLVARTAATDPARTSTVEHRALQLLSCSADDQGSEVAAQRQRLTERDLEVLRLLDAEQGLSADQVADLLFPSVDTARKRLTALTRRGVLTRCRRTRPGVGRRGVPPWQYALSPLGSAILAVGLHNTTRHGEITGEHAPRRSGSTGTPAAETAFTTSQPTTRAGRSGDFPDTPRSKCGSQTRSSQCGRTSAAPAQPATQVEVNRRCA